MTAHKLLASFLCLLLSLSALCRSVIAQGANSTRSSVTDGRSIAEEVRIERLIGLAKVWGTVKYFHPYLAYRDIDWDKALIEAIPKVNAAKTPQEFQSALNQMLAVVNDKSTRAEIGTEIKTAADQTPADVTEYVRTENRVLIIEATQIAKAVAKDSAALRGFVSNINQALPNASGVVFDWRSTTKSDEFETYYFETFHRQILTGILDTTVVLGSSRYRMHSGYPTQTASGTSYYYSGLVNPSPQVIAGRSKTKPPPIAFIVNQHSQPFIEIASGMQSGNGAVVIQEGDHPPASSSGAYTMELPDNVKVRIRTIELINPDGSIDLQPDAVVPKSTTDDPAMKEAIRVLQETKPVTKNRVTQPPVMQVSQMDKQYAEMQFPNFEYRLLALFRFWNVVNYFFPYKKLIGESWETVLPRFIPKFEANKDTTDYQLTVFELATEMHDSHAVVRNATFAAAKLFGFQTPAYTSYVENKSVVVKVLDDKAPIKVGDVVLSIDGEPVEKRREHLSRYLAASTPQSLMLTVHRVLLVGQKNSVVKLRVRGADNQERDVELVRSVSPGDPKFYAAMDRKGPIIQLLPSGYGYVDLGRLEVGDVDKMFETIKDTRAVIFDMRGYPTGSAWAIAPRLTEKKNLVAALFSRRLLEPGVLTSTEHANGADHSFAQKLPEAPGSVYKGKVVMLINEDAISRAEHAALFFEAATDVTFVGTPTQGANGDITFMVLPGNLPISFSGHDVRHADGRQLQRLGIQPHVRVAPTIQGIIDGRDEILEAAVKYLQGSLRK